MLQSPGIFPKNRKFYSLEIYFVNSGQAISFEDCFKVSALRKNSIYWLAFRDFSCLIPPFSTLPRKVIPKRSFLKDPFLTDYPKLSLTKPVRSPSGLPVRAHTDVLLRTQPLSGVLEMKFRPLMVDQAFGRKTVSW